MEIQEIQDLLPNLLQAGINPYHSSRSKYYRLLIIRSDSAEQVLLKVEQMRGTEVFYKQHQQRVGGQSFVQTVRDLGTKYRIHKDNYVIEQA